MEIETVGGRREDGRRLGGRAGRPRGRRPAGLPQRHRRWRAWSTGRWSRRAPPGGFATCTYARPGYGDSDRAEGPQGRRLRGRRRGDRRGHSGSSASTRPGRRAAARTRWPPPRCSASGLSPRRSSPALPPTAPRGSIILEGMGQENHEEFGATLAAQALDELRDHHDWRLFECWLEIKCGNINARRACISVKSDNAFIDAGRSAIDKITIKTRTRLYFWASRYDDDFAWARGHRGLRIEGRRVLDRARRRSVGR